MCLIELVSSWLFERVDGTVGGTVDRSMSGNKGLQWQRGGTECNWVAGCSTAVRGRGS